MRATFVPVRTARCTSASRATGVWRGSTTSIAAGWPAAPVKDAQPEDGLGLRHIVPKRKMVSAVIDIGVGARLAVEPNDCFSAAAAVAVQSRVLPSMWGVPMPALPITASV